jgi:hypothetical protein
MSNKELFIEHILNRLNNYPQLNDVNKNRIINICLHSMGSITPRDSDGHLNIYSMIPVVEDIIINAFDQVLNETND